MIQKKLKQIFKNVKSFFREKRCGEGGRCFIYSKNSNNFLGLSMKIRSSDFKTQIKPTYFVYKKANLKKKARQTDRQLTILPPKKKPLE